MNLVKKIFVSTLCVLSFSAFSQNYVYPELKTGVQNDITSLISDSNNFVNEADVHSSGNIAYLKYTSDIVDIFEEYDATTTDRIYLIHDGQLDQPDISSTEELISVGNGTTYEHEESLIEYEYFQCVQFAQVISNAGYSGDWKEPDIDAYLDEDTDLNWKLIAKFMPNGYYDGAQGGHVALAIASNSQGVYVIDQNWEGGPTADYGKVGIHLIPWSAAANYALVTIPSSGFI